MARNRAQNSRKTRLESRQSARQLQNQIKRDKMNAERKAKGLPPLNDKS